PVDADVRGVSDGGKNVVGFHGVSGSRLWRCERKAKHAPSPIWQASRVVFPACRQGANPFFPWRPWRTPQGVLK
ncbi:MAG TPA: hypothetical protein VF934_07255, partial [Burkholderiales bacterium]